MDETRAEQPGSRHAAPILASRAGLAAAIERVRIYERTVLPADQLAGLILAELDGTAAAGRGEDSTARSYVWGWCYRCGQPYEGADEPTCECAGDPPCDPDGGGPLSALHPRRVAYLARVRALHYMPADAGRTAAGCTCPTTATGTAGSARADYPPTCILTGAAGENVDDCTTHGHERGRTRVAGPAANPKIRYLARFTPEAWVRDQAIEVDAAGPQEWDCTTLALAHLDYLADVAARRRESLDDGEGVLDNDDLFKDDPDAPEWVRSWRGPFAIRVRTEPMVTVYWQAQASRAADIWYSTLADLAKDGDLTVPSLRDLTSTARIVLPEPVWAGAALAEVLHESGYEVDGSETVVVELAVHDEEPGAARLGAGTIAGEGA
jgi:hypothetical protein